MEQKREALMKRMADRHEKRILKSRNAQESSKIDLRATEKAFLISEPKELDMKTPIRQKVADLNVPQSSSPVVSVEDRANQHIAALATYVNTIVGFDDIGEMDLGENKKEAYKRIKDMLSSKATVAQQNQPQRRNDVNILFDKYNPREVTTKCRTMLLDSNIHDEITIILKKRMMSVRPDLAIYSDLALQTVLLHIFLSFHPAWLKCSLEAIFDANLIDSSIRDLSKFIIDNVFKSKKILKNKKFAQGSGTPIVTPAGKEALHDNFLTSTIKIMFLIEKSVEMKLIPNLTRMFSRSSMYKSLESVFADLNKEVLSGSSTTFNKVFVKLGIQPSYKQTFTDDYDYTAKGFDDFTNGVILAKLIEQIACLPHNSILSKLRDPQGDRIRKLKNVEVVLSEMAKIGLDTENVKPAHIVGGKKDQILSVLWSIIGVKICSQKKVLTVKEPLSLDDRMLQKFRDFGKPLNVDVPTLESLYDGNLFASAWRQLSPCSSNFEFTTQRPLFDQVVDLADEELCIDQDVSNHIGLFGEAFFERLNVLRKFHKMVLVIQRAWRRRKIVSKFREIVKLAIEQQKVNNTPTADQSKGVTCETDFEKLNISQNFNPNAVVIQRAWRRYKIVSKFREVVNLAIERHRVKSAEESSEVTCVDNTSSNVHPIEFSEVDISSDSNPNFSVEFDETTMSYHPNCSITSEDRQRQLEILERKRAMINELKVQGKERNEQTHNYLKSSEEAFEQLSLEPKTPELLEILRKKRQIAARQKEISEQLRRIRDETESFARTNSQDVAFIESVESVENQEEPVRTDVLCDTTDDREIAGNESIVEDVVVPFEIVDNNIAQTDERIEKAVVIIQKYYRGYSARKMIRDQIQTMQQKVDEYNRRVGGENDEFNVAASLKQNEDVDQQQESALMRLRKHSLAGLVDDNLSVVCLSATTIDRLTSLLPSLTKSFVVDFEGIEKMYDILAVSDRGYSYKSILKPIFNILYRCLRQKDASIKTKIASQLKFLSPKLFLLALAHKQLFSVICSCLIEIAEKWPTECHFKNVAFYLKRFDSISDQADKKKVAKLRKLCELIKN